MTNTEKELEETKLQLAQLRDVLRETSLRLGAGHPRSEVILYIRDILQTKYAWKYVLRDEAEAKLLARDKVIKIILNQCKQSKVAGCN